MKNGLLIWNVTLTLVTGFLLVMHFGSKKENGSGGKKVTGDSSAMNKQFRIAYFEMDSVAAKFHLAKDFQTEVISKEEAINTEMNNRGKAIQQKINFYQNEAQAGKLSQEQSDVASREIKGMDDEMKNRKQQLDQDYNNYVLTRQNEIKTKIKLFINEYNMTKGFTYILSDDPGLFYYQDSAYNITADVVKGLNEKYKPVKKN
ncbi:MAG: OmpH family outer membrane protein [Bacteroidota bacterium]|nr:OmpH family outer membrane protein [Bacteroidota bacterium]